MLVHSQMIQSPDVLWQLSYQRQKAVLMHHHLEEAPRITPFDAIETPDNSIDIDHHHHIYILLTRYPDKLSKAVSGLSWGYYSHVSIGFAPSDIFFSFTMKGFRIENPRKICLKKKKDVPCVLYSLPVSDATYQFLRAHVDDYQQSSFKWRFNLVGLALSMLHVPFVRRENHRFCSQFVAEALEQANAIKFKKRASIMLPKDFKEIPEFKLRFKGTLSGLVASTLATQAV